MLGNQRSKCVRMRSWRHVPSALDFHVAVYGEFFGKHLSDSLGGGYGLFAIHHQRGQVIRMMDDPLAPTAMVPLSLDDALNYAHNNNPILEAARLSIDMAEANRMASSATGLPRVDLEGNLDFKNDYDGASGSAEEGTLLVKLTWDIFDGNRTSATEMAAAHRESAALAVLHQRELEISEQVRIAWNSMLVDRKRMETLREAEGIALEAYNARYSLMVTGKETIINVLDTALEVLNVRTAVTTSDYRYRLSVYRLLHAMGRLNPGSINTVITSQPVDLNTIKAIAPNTLDPADLIAAPSGGQAAGAPAAETMMAPAEEIMSSTLPAPSAPAPEPDTSAGLQYTVGTMQVGSGTSFMVVLSANRDRTHAQTTHYKLNFPGSVVETFDIKGSPMYMIVVGPLPEPEARVVQGEAFDAGVLDAWLKKL